MKFNKALMAAASAVAILLTPIAAEAAIPNEAEQLRRLDIMLMVTSLRCRMGADNFQTEYRSFTASHLPTLNEAARTMERQLVKDHGAKGAKRALDRISVGMANEYGQGHPWLECAQLKEIAHELSETKDPLSLTQASIELLGPKPVVGGYWASR